MMQLQNIHIYCYCLLQLARPALEKLKKKPPHVRHRCQEKKKNATQDGCVASAPDNVPILVSPLPFGAAEARKNKPGSEDGFPPQPIDARHQMLSTSHRFSSPRYSALFLLFSPLHSPLFLLIDKGSLFPLSLEIAALLAHVLRHRRSCGVMDSLN